MRVFTECQLHHIAKKYFQLLAWGMYGLLSGFGLCAGHSTPTTAGEQPGHFGVRVQRLGKMQLNLKNVVPSDADTCYLTASIRCLNRRSPVKP